MNQSTPISEFGTVCDIGADRERLMVERDFFVDGAGGVVT